MSFCRTICKNAFSKKAKVLTARIKHSEQVISYSFQLSARTGCFGSKFNCSFTHCSKMTSSKFFTDLSLRFLKSLSCLSESLSACLFALFCPLKPCTSLPGLDTVWLSATTFHQLLFSLLPLPFLGFLKLSSHVFLLGSIHISKS